MAVILVIDDDLSARELLKTVLGYAGHEVHEAHDGAEALLRVHEIMPSLVIVDLLMPKIDGMEFVRRLRRHSATATIPVVFYTASYLESQAQNLAQLCGVMHIISKPSEPEQIFATVNAALGDKRGTPPKPATTEAQQDYLSGLTAALSRKAAHVVPRLEAMISLGLRLATERDPNRLLGEFCDSARRIIGAKVAMLAIRHQGDAQPRFQFTSGIPAALAATLWNADVFNEVQSTRQSCRLDSIPPDVPLPPEWPAGRAVLCAPISSPQHGYGWVALFGSTGGAGFSDEDESLAQILAAQVGRIYENGSLYAEVKRLNADLEHRIALRTAELMDSNKELEAFGYTVSHDLRVPLRAVIAHSTLAVESEGSRLSAASRRHLEQSIQSAHQMSQMVDGLLEFSRKGRGAFRVEPVDMNGLVDEVWNELMQQESGAAQLCIETLQPAQADRAMLREVWTNLLSNALKYSRTRERRTVTVTSEAQNDFIRYSVRDNGVGFDPEHADKLFRAFERLHSATEFSGTGVGLAIVERIVTRHGGRVWADSQPDQGATFCFTLPRTAPSRL